MDVYTKPTRVTTGDDLVADSRERERERERLLALLYAVFGLIDELIAFCVGSFSLLIASRCTSRGPLDLYARVIFFRGL